MWNMKKVVWSNLTFDFQNSYPPKSISSFWWNLSYIFVRSGKTTFHKNITMDSRSLGNFSRIQVCPPQLTLVWTSCGFLFIPRLSVYPSWKPATHFTAHSSFCYSIRIPSCYMLSCVVFTKISLQMCVLVCTNLLWLACQPVCLVKIKMDGWAQMAENEFNSVPFWEVGLKILWQIVLHPTNNKKIKYQQLICLNLKLIYCIFNYAANNHSNNWSMKLGYIHLI